MTKRFSKKSNKIFRKFITFFKETWKFFKILTNFQQKPVKLFVLYLTNFQKKILKTRQGLWTKSSKNLTKFCQQFLKTRFSWISRKNKQDFQKILASISKNQTRFSNKILKTRHGLWTKFSKNPTRFVNNFPKQGFHDFLEKSNKIFRKFKHLFQKSRKIQQDLQTSLKKRTLDNVTQFSQKTQQGFYQISKRYEKFIPRMPNMFSQMQNLIRISKFSRENSTRFS